MIGIYKITNPIGQVYIGQSSNIPNRFKYYKNSGPKEQRRLIDSFLAYGFDNHTFEVVEQCSIDELIEKERQYQEIYDCAGDLGLNCILGKTKDYPLKYCKETLEMKKTNGSKNNLGTHLSESTKEKIRQANLGKTLSEETKTKISSATKGSNNPNFGKKMSQESKNKTIETCAKKRELIQKSTP